jgi:cytidine deaminase
VTVPVLPHTPTVARLDARLTGPGSAACIEAEELAQLVEETGLDRHAILLASLAWARRWARAPLSNFEVGAAALAESGRLYLGANLEFDGLPLSQTIHAEQSAIAHAWSAGETGLSLIATSAAPCGFCRQFMLELPEPRPLLLLGDREPTTLDMLLPDAFGPKQLGRQPQLLRAGPHALVWTETPTHPLAELALRAASRASAPYTGAVAGVALETADGRRFAGSLAESAAYNPTLAPMQSSLITAYLGGARLDSIRSGLLVELEGAAISQFASATAVLASVAPHATLERLLVRRARDPGYTA